MMGVLGAFAISSLIHEYLVIANFNIWTGEQSFFFMIHVINLLVFPAFIEPSLRNHDKLPTIPTFTADYVKRFVVNNL
uniref:Wax synthase domain-containing protein n=1 Tax=Rhizophagus irregularis (strain DAOM 181602 / DAOM 197198 / MUCL 43194) TaxID=747089 RepID=U9UNN1_RHIID